MIVTKAEKRICNEAFIAFESMKPEDHKENHLHWNNGFLFANAVMGSRRYELRIPHDIQNPTVLVVYALDRREVPVNPEDCTPDFRTRLENPGTPFEMWYTGFSHAVSSYEFLDLKVGPGRLYNLARELYMRVSNHPERYADINQPELEKFFQN